MALHDEVRQANERFWDRMVGEGCGYTIPWLDLNAARIGQYATGELDAAGDPLFDVFPPSVLLDVEGKDVLCLAAGGGQQSAVFGLLGARVTVVDVAERQLERDREAAALSGAITHPSLV
jgi:2-polyprenyl-3-methyl-5-hydroxy-6-metoxy-1,4-benzoquinol methylase